MFKDINKQFQLLNFNKKLKINNYIRMQFKIIISKEKIQIFRKSLKIWKYRIPKSHKVHLKLRMCLIRFKKLNIKTNRILLKTHKELIQKWA